MKQTIILLVMLMALCFGKIYGQTSPVTLSDLYVTITQAGDTTLEIEGIQYLNDSSTVANSVQLNVIFNISNPASLSNIRLMYGSSEGGSEVLDMQCSAVNVQGQGYLMYQNMLFAINNGRVHIRRLIPTSVFSGYGFLRVIGEDISQRQISALVRNNIR
jgi:hypothetical protein